MTDPVENLVNAVLHASACGRVTDGTVEILIENFRLHNFVQSTNERNQELAAIAEKQKRDRQWIESLCEKLEFNPDAWLATHKAQEKDL